MMAAEVAESEEEGGVVLKKKKNEDNEVEVPEKKKIGLTGIAIVGWSKN